MKRFKEPVLIKLTTGYTPTSSWTRAGNLFYLVPENTCLDIVANINLESAASTQIQQIDLFLNGISLNQYKQMYSQSAGGLQVGFSLIRNNIKVKAGDLIEVKCKYVTGAGTVMSYSELIINERS